MSANDTTTVIARHRVGASRRNPDAVIPRCAIAHRGWRVSARPCVCGALFENRIVEMDCVPTLNALILDGMTQIVRD
jgi:hypothetical protein